MIVINAVTWDSNDRFFYHSHNQLRRFRTIIISYARLFTSCFFFFFNFFILTAFIGGKLFTVILCNHRDSTVSEVPVDQQDPRFSNRNLNLRVRTRYLQTKTLWIIEQNFLEVLANVIFLRLSISRCSLEIRTSDMLLNDPSKQNNFMSIKWHLIRLRERKCSSERKILNISRYWPEFFMVTH